MNVAATESAIDGWQTTPLKAEVTLKNGKAYNAKSWKNEGYPIIRIQNLKDPSASFNYFQGDPETQVPIRRGDLVFSWSGSKGTSFGPHVWYGELGVLNQHIFKVILNPDSQLNQDFLFFALKFLTAQIEEKAYGLAALVHVRKGDLEATPIPLPPLSEQKTITYILSTVQRAIEAQERIIQTTTELKKALMHKLFTEGLRNEPQKQTEIGPVPGSWKVVKLETTGEVVYGIQASVANNFAPVGTRILTNKNLTLGGRFDLEKINYFELTTKRHRATILRKGDLLFNWRSGSKFHVGKTSFFDLDGEWVHSSFILRIRPNPEINGRYLFYYLNHLREAEYFVKLQTYAINAKFNKSAVNALTTVVPSREEQDEIADTLDASQSKINSAENKRKALQDLFRTLLHELMTAKTRVHDLELHQPQPLN